MTLSREERAGGVPTLSVVLVSSGGGITLTDGLAALREVPGPKGAELIVVRPAPPGEPDDLPGRYPHARFVTCVSGSVAQLRAAGMREAKGDIVALIEVRQAVSEGWVDRFTDEISRAKRATEPSNMGRA